MFWAQSRFTIANIQTVYSFTNIQHLFLLVAKEHTNCDYRKFVESLYDSKIPKCISLKRIPHFTTLQKVAKRLQARLLEKLVFLIKELFPKQTPYMEWGDYEELT